jgi:hypothetical protein
MQSWKLKEANQQCGGDSQSLIDFMRRSPLCGLDELKFERVKGVSRDIEF